MSSKPKMHPGVTHEANHKTIHESSSPSTGKSLHTRTMLINSTPRSIALNSYYRGSRHSLLCKDAYSKSRLPSRARLHSKSIDQQHPY